jgi:hypothetical protein
MQPKRDMTMTYIAAFILVLGIALLYAYRAYFAPV